MKYLLGIDQGTTQTTAVVVDENASFVDVNSIPLPAQFPRPGWVEQDPHDIVRTVIEAVTPLIEKYDIAAVGFDNQGETFVVWDNETGEPLTPAIVWQDKRGVEVCDALASQVDNDSLRRKTGLILDSYFSAARVKHVHLLKLDVEGAEFRALTGLGEYLDPEFLDFVQFEYGGANLDARIPLKAFFELFEAKGFVVARLLPTGLQVRAYRSWMDNYAYANYVAISRPIYERLVNTD